MSSWIYQHDPGRVQLGCRDPEGVELSVGSCTGSVDITIRHPGGDPDGEVIASIHLPADQVLDLVEMLLGYGGIAVEEAIAHLRDRLADQETELLSPDASRQRPEAG